MVSASMRAYRDGPDTMDERRQLVVDVLNSTPLAGRVGHGEVIGLGEGLALWFGADFNRANALLRKAGDGDANLPEAGRSEEHTSELQSLMRISYAVFCLKKKKKRTQRTSTKS